MLIVNNCRDVSNSSYKIYINDRSNSRDAGNSKITVPAKEVKQTQQELQQHQERQQLQGGQQMRKKGGKELHQGCH